MDGVMPVTLDRDLGPDPASPITGAPAPEPLWEWVSVRAGDSAMTIAFPVPVPRKGGV